MAHLAQVASEVRIGLKLLTASLIVVALLFVFFKGGEIVKNIFFPTPPAPPEEKFGKLPPISFPVQNPQQLEYRINTLTGKLPTFPDRMKVYRIIQKSPSLVALKLTKENLKRLGYTENETKISEEEYQWTNTENQTIRINTSTGNFKIFSNFLSDPPKTLNGEGARKDGAFTVVKRVIENLGQDIEDLDQDSSTITYLKLENGTLLKANSLNEANFARLDIFQKNLDNYKIFYPGLSESIMNFTIEDGDNLPSIVDASFYHYIPDSNSASTYPLKTSDVAFEDLKKGDALIFLDNKDSELVDITDVSLGYYIGSENQQYFLPIIIFKGKGFTAYVQATP